MSSKLSKTISYLFITLFVITPYLLTPWTSELFELPKITFLYLITILITTTWLLHLPLTGKIPFRRTPLDIPISIFLISQILSTIFSVHTFTSIWGYYSRFHGGLASTICYLILYYAFVTFFSERQLTTYNSQLTTKPNSPPSVVSRHLSVVSLINIILPTSLPLAIYGIAEHFGIDAHLWVQDVRNRVFSTLGQPNWLAAYMVVLLPFSYVPLLNRSLKNLDLQPNQQKNKETKKQRNNKFPNFSITQLPNYLITNYQILLPATYYLCLLYTGSRSGFLAFIASSIIFWGLLFWKHWKLKIENWSFLLTPFVICNLIFVILSATSSTPFTPSLLDLINKNPSPSTLAPNPSSEGGTESGDIRKIVWRGAFDLGKRYPLLGTGPETFAYTYYWTRPLAHNLVSEWDFLYNKAHNEYLNFFATTGLIGLGSYLLLITSFIWIAIKNYKLQITNYKQIKSQKIETTLAPRPYPLDPIIPALLAAYTTILITNFFGFSVVTIGIYFFLLPAFWVVLTSQNTQLLNYQITKLLNYRLSKFLLISLISSISIYALFSLYRFISADLSYNQAQKLYNTNLTQAVPAIHTAIRQQPHQAIYHDLAAQIYADLAANAHASHHSTLSAQLSQYAIESSNHTITLNPVHLNLWKSRASALITLSSINPEYLKHAAASLQHAATLAPTDPKIIYNLALIYAKLSQTDQAIQTLHHTLQLKPDYPDAAKALEILKNKSTQE